MYVIADHCMCELQWPILALECRIRVGQRWVSIDRFWCLSAEIGRQQNATVGCTPPANIGSMEGSAAGFKSWRRELYCFLLSASACIGAKIIAQQYLHCFRLLIRTWHPFYFATIITISLQACWECPTYAQQELICARTGRLAAMLA